MGVVWAVCVPGTPAAAVDEDASDEARGALPLPLPSAMFLLCSAPKSPVSRSGVFSLPTPGDSGIEYGLGSSGSMAVDAEERCSVGGTKEWRFEGGCEAAVAKEERDDAAAAGIVGGRESGVLGCGESGEAVRSGCCVCDCWVGEGEARRSMVRPKVGASLVVVVDAMVMEV